MVGRDQCPVTCFTELVAQRGCSPGFENKCLVSLEPHFLGLSTNPITRIKQRNSESPSTLLVWYSSEKPSDSVGDSPKCVQTFQIIELLQNWLRNVPKLFKINPGG